MRYLEVRRHSKRERPNQHLSQWGVNLARHVGEELGTFDQVVTSPLPRCIETAVAMGFAVNEIIEQLAGDDGRGETFPGISKIDWKAGYSGFAYQLKKLPSLANFVQRQAQVWREIVRVLPEGGRALLIGHGGGFLEGTAVFCLPQADHRAWGAVSVYCEGIRLSFEGNEFTEAEILRVKQSGPTPSG